jgi:hypothetical protein
MATHADVHGRIHPLVYLGGMARVRGLVRLGQVLSLMTCAVFLWREVAHHPTDVHRFITLYLGGLLFAIVSRLGLLRQVVATRDGWVLAPIIGPPRPIPPVRQAFVRGHDVVAVAFDGRLVVLGVDRFPHRDAATIRRRLVRDLPRR